VVAAGRSRPPLAGIAHTGLALFATVYGAVRLGRSDRAPHADRAAADGGERRLERSANHDWWYDGPALERELERSGVRVLENAAVRVERPGGAFWVAGLADLESRRAQPSAAAALAAVPTGAPVILLTHWPDPWPQAPPRVALTLAGHTHCGQVNLPVLGRLVHASRAARHWGCGLYEEAGRKLFVTSGLGVSILPVRFRAPPEIAIITLKAPGP
jgi:predicted MPP superfamily phosphohydrolase